MMKLVGEILAPLSQWLYCLHHPLSTRRMYYLCYSCLKNTYTIILLYTNNLILPLTTTNIICFWFKKKRLMCFAQICWAKQTVRFSDRKEFFLISVFSWPSQHDVSMIWSLAWDLFYSFNMKCDPVPRIICIFLLRNSLL